MYIEH